MTGHIVVAVAHLLHLGLVGATDRGGMGAAGNETAPARRIDRRGYFTTDIAFADVSLKLYAGRRKPMAADDFVRRHEADIMSVVLVFWSRITRFVFSGQPILHDNKACEVICSG